MITRRSKRPTRFGGRWIALIAAALGLLVSLRGADGTVTAETPYRHFQSEVRHLLESLAALMQPGAANLVIAGPESELTRKINALERVSRTMYLAACYLRSEPQPDDAALRSTVAAWYRQALVLGSDPHSRWYFGPDTGGDQHQVEMALLAIGLQVARSELWDPLTPAQKTQVAAWLATVRGNAAMENNHALMPVHVLEFVDDAGFGERGDRAIIDAFLDDIDAMYRGDGWYIDGANQTFDYYNAYAFQFFGLWWERLYGRHEPERAARWREHSRAFVNHLQYFFAASGEHPAFGRSMIYRFNIVDAFGLAAAERCSDLPPGELRRLCLRNVDFFLSRPIYQRQGVIAFGWTDHFEDVAEPYSGSGGPYWCAMAFTPLILPSSDPFWAAPDAPYPSERGDFVHLIPTAGLVLRGVDGEVELINAGMAPGWGIRSFGVWKWTKVAYRTGTAFTLATAADDPKQGRTAGSLDEALTFERADGARFGRYASQTTAMDTTHVCFRYNYGVPGGDFSAPVEASVWWKAGWLLEVYHVSTSVPGSLHLGGFVLPSLRREISVQEGDDHWTARDQEGRRSTLQLLTGFPQCTTSSRTNDGHPRTAIWAPYHVFPVASTATFSGDKCVAALVWTGRSGREGEPWHLRRMDAGHWTLVHPVLGTWELTDPALPAVARPSR